MFSKKIPKGFKSKVSETNTTMFIDQARKGGDCPNFANSEIAALEGRMELWNR